MIAYFAPNYRRKITMTADKLTTFDVLIEIPRGSRNKYEYDFEIKECVLIECCSLHVPSRLWIYPRNISFRRNPLDVLVLVTEPTFPGCVMEVKPIGVFHMADDKGPDEK
jgi:inorganic pyrophosphatase